MLSCINHTIHSYNNRIYSCISSICKHVHNIYQFIFLYTNYLKSNKKLVSYFNCFFYFLLYIGNYFILWKKNISVYIYTYFTFYFSINEWFAVGQVISVCWTNQLRVSRLYPDTSWPYLWCTRRVSKITHKLPQH